MKKIIAIALLCVSTLAAATFTVALTTPYTWQVVRVIDGDTVVVKTPWIPPELGDTMSIRIYGIDTPEKSWRAKCDAERALSAEATQFVIELLENNSYEIVLVKWDKFGGRILGDFIIDGARMADLLLEQGLAQPYTGSGTKPTWCN